MLASWVQNIWYPSRQIAQGRMCQILALWLLWPSPE